MKNFFLEEEEIEFLEEVGRSVLGKCSRKVSVLIDDKEIETTIYIPGGDDKYSSFWIRDAVMHCASGLVPVSEMEIMFDLILSYQNDENIRNLENGLRILPWAFADHINVKGLDMMLIPGAVFYPGASSPLQNQGTGRFGNLNVADSPYEVVELAYIICNSLYTPSKISEFLAKPVKGISRIDRLDISFDSVSIDQKTGLHYNTKDCWAAEGFHDTLMKMGYVFLSSCMRSRAAKRMAKLFQYLGKETKSLHYKAMFKQISSSINRIFPLNDGWLSIASELDRQADVWGTSLAVYEGVLEHEIEQKAIEAMLKAYTSGTVAYKGYLRHTPTTYDAIPGKQVWEDGYGEYGIYISGGYWPQANGWYVYALAKVDLDLARKLAREFIEHTRSFLQEGAPFEWISPTIPLTQTPRLGRWYGPSIALPLSGFRRIQNTILS